MFIATKVAAAIGGLMGGIGFMAFLKPKSIMDAAIRGGVSTGTAIIGSAVSLEMIGLPVNIEYSLFMGAVIGFVSWGVLGLVARFFIKAEETNQTILDVVKEIKETKPEVKKQRKPRAKKN